MKRTILLLTTGLLFTATATHAQVSISTLNTPVIENFDSFDGSGFAPAPAAGQLDSDNFAVAGLSDGDLDFGESGTSGDYARGTSTGGETTGGVYAFDVGSGDDAGSGDFALGIQPGGDDFTPGSFTLRYANDTGGLIAAATVNYDVYVYNNEGRSSTFDLSVAAGPCSSAPSYAEVAGVSFVSPQDADATPIWVATSRSATLYTSVSAGECLFLRFSSDDANGSGSRDELALDNVSVTASAQVITLTFGETEATAAEDDGLDVLIPVSISTSDAMATDRPVTAVVSLTGGSATADDFASIPPSQRSITFAAGVTTPGSQLVNVGAPFDDTEREGMEEGEFTLTSDEANAITDSLYTLTIRDDEVLRARDLIITEFMAHPDAVGDSDGEYIEVYNASGATVDLSGIEIADDDFDDYIIGSSVLVNPGEVAVLCRNGAFESNGGVPCDYTYTGVMLGNDDDEIILRDTGDLIARVSYGDGTINGPGIAYELRALSLAGPDGVVRRSTLFSGVDGLSGAFRPFIEATALLSGGDHGSPGTLGNTAEGVSDMTLGNLGGTGNAEDIGWYVLSVPATGFTLSDLARQNGVQGVEGFSPAAAANIYTSYDGGTTDPNAVADFFEPTGGGSFAFTPGNGFIWYHFDNDAAGSTALPYTLSATGSEPASAPSFTLPAGEFYMAGNPWQNALVLSDVTESGGAGTLGDNAQVYDPFNDSYRAALSRTGSPDTVGVWQGFFLEETGGIDPVTVEIVDSGVNGGNFVGRQALAERRLGFVLRGRNDDLGVTTYDEAALLRFNALATADNDAFDGSKLNPLTGVYGTIAFVGERGGEAHLRAVESRPYDAEGFAVEMDVQTSIAGTFTLTWPLQEDLPEAWPLELEDRVTGEVIDLRASESYTFEASPEAAPRVTAETLAEARRALPATLRAEPSWLQAETRSTGPRFVLRVGATGVAAEGDDLPGGYRLSAVYPNPFNPQAQFALTLSEAQAVRAEVFDALGRRVAVLADGVQAAGSETYRLDGRALASGVYVIRVAGERFVETRRVTLVK